VGFKPEVGCVSDAEPVSEAVEEYGMVNRELVTYW